MPVIAQPDRQTDRRPADAKQGSRGLTQAYDLRDLAAKMGEELRGCPAETLQDKATRARALRDCVSVWDSARDAIRVMKGRPLPGSLRPEKPKSKTARQTTGPVESFVEQEPAKPTVGESAKLPE